MHTDDTSYGKPATGFRRLGSSLEPESLDLGQSYTSVDRFFVCNAGSAPSVDAAAWRLHVEGDAVAEAIEWSLDELLELEQVTLVSWLECAGNGRRLFNVVAGHDLSEDPVNTQWHLGGMGQATWSGPRLSDVMAGAGVGCDVAFVGPSGLDHDNGEGETIRMSLPIAKAMHDDTIVALTMNGEPLGTAHGAPARLLVPGWIGAYSVKWLDRLELSSSWIDSYRSNEYYVLRDAAGNITGPATVHPVKSQLRLEWNASLDAGQHTIMGYARSGVAPVISVDYSIDDGPWQSAELLDDLGRWAWRQFSISVDLASGPHTIRTRATDGSGARQPEDQRPHRDGVLWSAVIPHPVVVA